MISELAGAYLWLKALHVISMVAWMAGMFYLPRLFVYHTQTAVGSQGSELFKVMERKLLRFIINPAMIATWLFGILMLVAQHGMFLQQPWFHVKLTALIGLQIFHAFCSRWRKAFLHDRNQHSDKFFRMANEIPTVLFIVIVIMVVVKPF